MATDMGKLQNKEISMLPIIWERNALRGIFKGCTIVVWTILNFVHLNMIEMKRSVSRWMSLRKKISAIIWRKQNIFDTEGMGGFLSTIPEHLDHWKIVLTSTRRCPHYTIYTKNLENDNSGQCHSGSVNTGTNHRVLPPVGGNGAISGGTHNNSNESPHMSGNGEVRLGRRGRLVDERDHCLGRVSRYGWSMQLERLRGVSQGSAPPIFPTAQLPDTDPLISLSMNSHSKQVTRQDKLLLLGSRQYSVCSCVEGQHTNADLARRLSAAEGWVLKWLREWRSAFVFRLLLRWWGPLVLRPARIPVDGERFSERVFLFYLFDVTDVQGTYTVLVTRGHGSTGGRHGGRCVARAGAPHSRKESLHRKAMVDEEVYAGDGDETSEALKASDGDRRTIADADQAGQLAISGERKTSRADFVESLMDGALHDPRTWTRLVPILRGKSRETTCSYVQWLRAERCHASRSRQRAVIAFLFSKKRECEDLTRELLRHFESYGFLKPVIV